MSFSKITHGRLLVESLPPPSLVAPSLVGAWNMAVDEVLLEEAADRDLLTLRFYSWSMPTVSLGYFQQLHDRTDHAGSLSCPLVRRSSGGGAIVHGPATNDLTYAVAVPTNRQRGAVTELYDCFHDALIDVLVASGLDARRCPVDRKAEPKPFLCFQRHTAGDVLIGDHKVGGSAQRRRGSAVLQHGTLLIDGLAEAPELPGLCQLHPEPNWQPTAALQEEWLVKLNQRWSVEWTNGQLLDSEIERAKHKMSDKFLADPWTARR